MEKISGIVITFNEEKNIRRCLSSLKEVCDEIIVVDSFSTDKTEEICKEFNTKFIKHEFEGYREQKNFALSLASFKFVLSLDADEELSSELKKFILKTKKTGLKYDAYKFNRLNKIGNKFIKHGDWYPDAKIRLWNKEKGKWGGKNVHETVIMDKNTKITKVKLDILHYPYDDIFSMNMQFVNFAKLWAKDTAEMQKKSSLLKAILKSNFNFFKSYFLKAGFLDGRYGYILAKSKAFYTFLKYAGIKEFGKIQK